MQITKSSKKNKNLYSLNTTKEKISPNISITNKHIPTTPTEIIPIPKSVVLNITQKPISIVQNQKFPECYYTLQQTQGYLNITDRQIYLVCKNERHTRKYPSSLNKTKQISQFIINNHHKTVQSQHRLSKSLNDNSITQSNTSVGSIVSTYRHIVNKKISARRNISLTLKIVYCKQNYENNMMLTRAKRCDKGGVVDLALSNNDKPFCPIQYYSNRSMLPPKKLELAAIIIQRWWKRILILFKKINCQIVLIQSFYKRYLLRKEFSLIYCLEVEKKKQRLMNKYGLFALFIVKTIQLNINNIKHHLFLIFAHSIIISNKRDDKYRTGANSMALFCKKVCYKDIMSLFKQKRLYTIVHRLQLLKLNIYLTKWITLVIRFKSFKQKKLELLLNQRIFANDNKNTLVYFKSFIKWETVLNRDINLKKSGQLKKRSENLKTINNKATYYFI